MELELDSLHVVAAYAALVLGVLGPVVALIYAFRVDNRSRWRIPMLVSATLSFVAIVTVYVSGRNLVADHPRFLNDPSVMAHVAYADRLILPAGAFFLFALLTGILNPRTGALRIALPMMTSVLAVLVLFLVVLSGDSGARTLLERLVERF